MANLSGRQKKIEHILAKTRDDDGFKKRLLANPKATLKAEGFEVSELSDQDLDKVSGGGFDDFGGDEFLQDQIRGLEDKIRELEDAVKRILDNAIFVDDKF